jgi:hypothetical protein
MQAVYGDKYVYEVVSKIFRTGAAIYTAVVIAGRTGPSQTVRSRFYCDVTPNLARTDLAVSP